MTAMTTVATATTQVVIVAMMIDDMGDVVPDQGPSIAQVVMKAVEEGAGEREEKTRKRVDTVQVLDMTIIHHQVSLLLPLHHP